MKILLILIINCFYCGYSFACFSPTGELSKNHANLIDDTEQIIYAEAVKVTDTNTVEHADEPAIYYFRVISVLKGQQLQKLSLKGDKNMKGLWDTTFEDHSSSRFWARRRGRLGNIGDCKTTPAPQFVIGKKYLLFINGPDDSKKYERVDTVKDKWFEFIIKYLNNK
jgi:hypothetical protein